MEQSMDRGKCGGSYGGTEHLCILEDILLKSRTLIISSSLTSLCSILLSGQSILFIADSSTNVCIEDCYIESGDDLVAVKSGWDHYGMAVARPSSNILIRRIFGTTRTCSGIGIGSEMPGGIFNITVEDIHVWDSAAGLRIKTDKGRGWYISNIIFDNVLLEKVKVPIRFSSGSNDHPDNKWDPKALPRVKGVYISNVVSLNSRKAPMLLGVEGTLFQDICFRNVTLLGLPQTEKWKCKDVSGMRVMFSLCHVPSCCRRRVQYLSVHTDEVLKLLLRGEKRRP